MNSENLHHQPSSVIQEPSNLFSASAMFGEDHRMAASIDSTRCHPQR
jgi:hypothetical protein